MTERPPIKPHAAAAIALVACSILVYEVLLTRVAALRLHFHFGFLIISNCLLAIGMSGTIITLRQKRWAADPRRVVWRFSAWYIVSLAVTWAFVLGFQLPEALRFDSAAEIVRFAAFNLGVAVPFVFGGMVVGLLLTFHAERVNAIYAADLLGAGAGCLICPAVLTWAGAGGCLVAAVLLAVAALAVVAPPDRRRISLAVAAALLLAGAILLPRLDHWVPVPGKGLLDLTATYHATIARATEYSRWSVNSRIDVLPVPPPMRFMFARGTRALALPLAEQKLILQDGSAGTIVSDFSGTPAGLRPLRLSLYSAALQLKNRPEVFIIGIGGGNDVWAARAHGARRIRAVELNRAVLDVHRELVPGFSKKILNDPRIELVVAEGRTALMRERGRYDLIQMTGIDTWTSLTSGAYVLAENYLYTTEALAGMLARLRPGGLIQITRMAAEMETLRLLANLHAALPRQLRLAFPYSVICLATPDMLTATLIKSTPFTPKEVERMIAFARAAGIWVVYVPGPAAPRSVIRDFIHSRDKETFIASFPRDISPTTDDRPYFFNFTRWSRPLAAAAHIREPTRVSQGNPLMLLVQLGLSTVLALTFIILPLRVFSRDRQGSRQGRGWSLVYFSGVGVGFIIIEVSLIQKLTLVLGAPLYSIVVTLFSLLVFTGLGSMITPRLMERHRWAVVWVPAAICALLLGLVLLGPQLVTALVGRSTVLRLAGAAAVVAPVGLLLGIPFAQGIQVLRRVNPLLIPWAWAINGCSTVVGSVATVILSMNLGFNAVLLGAGAVYMLAFVALAALRRLPAVGDPSAATDSMSAT